jgi:hypothetical protein
MMLLNFQVSGLSIFYLRVYNIYLYEIFRNYYFLLPFLHSVCF